MSGSKTKSNTIKGAADDAYLLIQHLAKRGIDMDFSKIDPVVQVSNSDYSKIESVDEAKFWDAVAYLANVASPVTVDSLKILIPLDSDREENRLFKSLKVFRDIRVFVITMSVITIYVFFTLILRLDYVSAVSGYLDRYEGIQKQSKRIEAKEFSGTELEGLTPTQSQINTEMQNLETEGVLTLYSLYNLSKENFKNIVVKEDAVDGTKKTSYQIAAEISGDPQYVGEIIAFYRDRLRFNQSYLLPILLSVLGSCVYILRNTSKQVYDYTIGYVSFPLVILRLSVGAIAGVVIGWLYKNSDNAFALTPIALSFLAGYSVEVLFSALDRLTSAFTDPVQKQKSKPGNVIT